MTQNFYHVLGVTRHASKSDVRAAYVRLVKLHHPDVVGDLPKRLDAVQQAYRCLMDESARAAHDRAIADREARYQDQQRRVIRRLRKYDERHPFAVARPKPPRRLSAVKLLVLASVFVAVCAWRLVD